MIRRISPVLTVFLSLALALPAFGWGDEGHRLVARIAARHLTVPAMMRIATIIRAVPPGQDDLKLASLVPGTGAPTEGQIEAVLATIATWPDHMPGGKKETEPWHFIDIGLAEGPANMNQRCASGCVNQKITEIRQDLKANKPLTGTRTFPVDRELRFLVHFAGDIHQPLHAATNADAGGNCIHTNVLETSRELHAVWDTALVELVINGTDADTASEIIQKFKAQQAIFQSLLDPNQIAAESFGLAKTVAYGQATPKIPVIPQFIELTPSQCTMLAPAQINSIVVDAKTSFDNPATLQIVSQQLYKAGVRLAAMLNSL